MIKLNYDKVEKTQKHIELDETKKFYLKAKNVDNKMLILYDPTNDNLLYLEKNGYSLVHYVVTSLAYFTNYDVVNLTDVELITKEEFKAIYKEWFNLLLDEVKDE